MKTASKKEPPKKQPPELPPQPPQKSRAPAPVKAAARRKPPTEKLQIISASFTRERAATLASVAQECSDVIGRTISPSAVLRAVVELVGKGTLPVSAIVATIEAELASGRKWGARRY